MSTTYADSGGGGRTVQVTRNVPPKRVRVQPGNVVVYGGKEYKGGDVFVLGEGPAADQLAFSGHVVVEEHDAADEWNGPIGDQMRKDALAALDAEHKAAGTERTHDHGFAKYKHADKNGEPTDVTDERQEGAGR